MWTWLPALALVATAAASDGTPDAGDESAGDESAADGDAGDGDAGNERTGAPGPAPAALSLAELDALLAAGEAAAREGASDFGAQVDTLAARLPGLGRPLSEHQAARFHRLAGIHAYAAGGLSAAMPSFGAARRLEAAAPLLSGLDLSSTELGEAYASIQPALLPEVALALPAPTRAWVDGREGGARGRELPAIVQLETTPGAVSTTLLGPGEALRLPAPAPPRPQHRRRHPGWAWAAGGLGVAALGLAGSAVLVHRQFDALPAGTSRGRAESLQSANQGLALAAAASLGLGLGAGTVALLPPAP